MSVTHFCLSVAVGAHRGWEAWHRSSSPAAWNEPALHQYLENSLEGSQVTHPEGSQVTHPEGSQVTHPEGSQVTHPEGSQVTHPEGSQVTRPEGSQVTRPEGSQVTHPEGSQVTHLEGSQVTQMETYKMTSCVTVISQKYRDELKWLLKEWVGVFSRVVIFLSKISPPHTPHTQLV